MLIKYKYENKIFNLGPEEKESKNNIYTILVGKNGTGKSRLLKSIIERFIGENKKIKKDDEESASLFKYVNEIKTHNHPRNIIAISTSPFDKFPLDDYKKDTDYYSYLGLRNLRAPDLGKAYMSKVFTSLVFKAFENKLALQKISEILNYLGYEGFLEGRYHMEISPTKMKEVLNSGDPIEEFISEVLENKRRFQAFRGIDKSYFLEDEYTISVEKVHEFIMVYRRIRGHVRKPRIQVVISNDGIFSNELLNIEDDFKLLVGSGSIKLRELVLHKKNTKSSFMINDASSGEQSVVMSILGIASEIEDGSLICIDEPEVCLHPQWQEKYIELLISTFKEFKQCHFLIATHSPLIVSKLQKDSCFVMSMDDGLLIPAEKINNRSVDFQLARIFKTPGYKNEFLTRVLISALAGYSENGELSSEEVIELKSILELRDLVDDSDPVKRLMDIAEESIKGLS